MIEYIILGITFAFAAAIQPGPLQTYLISQTLLKGWRKTLPAAAAPIFSDGPIILLVIFILSNLPKIFLNILQIAGGFFLLYLAYNSYKSWKNFTTVEKDKTTTKNQTLLKAVTVNLLNPNPYLGWSLVMGPLLLKGWNQNPIYGIALLTSFYVTITAGLVITILLASAARKMGAGTNKVLIAISAMALTLFGLYSLYKGFSVFL